MTLGDRGVTGLWNHIAAGELSMAEIRPMNLAELRQLVDWANNEGWNPGRNDVDCFWNLDPEGFLAVIENGQFAGGGAIIRHSDSFGFMGLFIVSQPLRGRGLGTQLWYARRDRLLSRLRDGGTIGLDGVDAMVPFYAKGGFREFTRHRRFQLNTPAAGVRRSERVMPLEQIELTQIADYDSRCFPARREQFMSMWMQQSGAVSLAVAESGQLQGFGVMRPCVTGWKIGPLFADSIEIADELFQAFQLECGDQPVFLDVPDANSSGRELAEKFAMEEVFGCTRMYHGEPPSIDHERVFGVTTLEVG